jgi:putative toxin-antitoxin system antitoxin component (TIGR02293 family)
MQRTHEIGVRTALGASRGRVMGLVIRHALLLTGAGLALGIAGAVAGTRFMVSLLFGVQPNDLLSLAAAALALGAVGTPRRLDSGSPGRGDRSAGGAPERVNRWGVSAALPPGNDVECHLADGRMTATEYLVDVLGGASVFKGSDLPTSTDLRERIRKGLPYRSLESVRARLQLSVPEAVRLLHMPARTLARRRQTRKLGADESDRLYRIARVAAQAFAVFGAEDKATAWLRRPNRALNGEQPFDLLDTDVGSRQVEDILGRIEHGVLS